MDQIAPAGPVSTVPRHTMDLRPAADAAAIARDPLPDAPLGVPAALPPQTAQVAAVSRALLDGSADAGPAPVRPPERVLKPWGIQMLPRAPDEGTGPTPDAARRPPEDGEEAGASRRADA
ncbi:hypothetical protein [Wenxinia marina]|uniref:Uncharacterized protein n=1 Tax=Wenxinia marina DSM 24838 TaxID=1123501 RepID=A0A0D0Q8X4_9RHOB|nr:hypothetical protein [Wenxinia marina]KIQ68822.1 hypothetical protein Wenmar_02550 [Wenxinia marina DSM 24838]GGL64957.1 hypothetical protein GCM10011392_19490 [Wenxinia marina]